MGEDHRRSRSFDEDRIISSLPDELLHETLARLRCQRAAARTSVLSRRWRHVWATLPELLLDDDGAGAPSVFLGTVDGALAGYSAPTLARLRISLSADRNARICVPARRVQHWLRFASERGVGELRIVVPPPKMFCPRTAIRTTQPADGLIRRRLQEWGGARWPGGPEELDLPAWEGATRIDLVLLHLQQGWLLQPPSAGGVFAALTSLTIKGGHVTARDLAALVNTQCPRLRHLDLALRLVPTSDISLRSGSLRSLGLRIRNALCLEVVAPRLDELTVGHATKVRISAPSLAKLTWCGNAYDPCRHQLADVSRRLQLLEISLGSVVASLIQQFDEIDELRLHIHIPEGIEGYESFLNETNKLPKCRTFRISLCCDNHDLLSLVLHLLRRCNSTRKLSIQFFHRCRRESRHSCSPSCPCRFKESRKIDGVILSSLEEVEIGDFTNSEEKLEFLEFLSHNAVNLKKFIINYKRLSGTPLTKEIYEKVRIICCPNVRVEFYVFTDGKWVYFD